MRIPIRLQLGSLILLSSLIGLAVISIAVWVTVHGFVLDLRAERLSLIATLKVAELQSNLDIMQTSSTFVSSRVLIQSALMRYNDFGNNTTENWEAAEQDLSVAIGGSGSIGQQLLLQSRIYGKNGTGAGGSRPLLSSTASSVAWEVELPYRYPNGSSIPLGATGPEAGPYGYPPPLYPNLTFSEVVVNGIDVPQAQTPDGRVLDAHSTLLLGPWQVNSTMSLISLTMAVTNNTDSADILGWLTTVMDARLIQEVVDAKDGLGKTGETLLIGPADQGNYFPAAVYQNSDGKGPPEFAIRYVLPLSNAFEERHPDHVESSDNLVFNATDYPTVYDAIATLNKDSTDNNGSYIRTKNEAGDPVSVGYALTTTDLVQWIIIVEMARPEVWQPINHLRNVILACLFATIGLMLIISFPLAHFTCLPILRLRDATARSVLPPNSNPRSSQDSYGSFRDGAGDDGQDDGLARKEGFRNPVKRVKHWWDKKEESSLTRREERRKRAVRIPAKVKERKYWIKDELSDLTMTFNEMSDELMLQYSRLEERVQQRTAELEHSKKAAEAANESKTLFIANISHELKTPLNGILGMCAVCMQEDDPLRLKRSLGIIYKSGDLLLNLLTDLLTFSKNQVGQSLSLDEKDFRMRDVSSQILAIFDKQAKDGAIDLQVQFEGASNLIGEHPSSADQEPVGIGRLKDMILWGDVHRILQVVINLVSNSLKFTPRGGSVVLTIRCLPEIPEISISSRKTSLNSRRQSSRHRLSDANQSSTRLSTANAINVKDKPHALAYMNSSERTASPPPGKWLYFEFSVQDSGPGIPDNLQTKIFEPFVQGDLGLSKKFGGTGLGLSICSQLAALMRGSIAVRSTVGTGSTFTMKIPLRLIQSHADSSASSAVERWDGSSRGSSIDEGERTLLHGPMEQDQGSKGSTRTGEGKPSSPVPAVKDHLGNDSQPRLVGLSQPFFASEPLESPGSQSAAMDQITAEATRGGRIRVLVAEDNKVNQEVVLRMLKLEDIYDVTVAKDGQEALDLVRESMQGDTPNNNKPYNLIFMDVQMPNVDGLTSTKMIREIGYRAPIVALTAFAEESNIKDCLDSGMNYFLSKPIRRPQLKKVLKEYCAPIPEVDEDTITPPEERRGSGINTTIVLRGSPVHGATAPESLPQSSPLRRPPNEDGMDGDARSDLSPKDV